MAQLRIANRCIAIALPFKSQVQQIRNMTYMKKKLVSVEEYLKISRTAGASYNSVLKRLNLAEPLPNFNGTSSEVQLLKNLSSHVEYIYLRPNKSFIAYYRIDLLMQRLQYLSSMGMTPRDKLALLKKKPPVFIVCEHELFDSSGMAYLRGIIKYGAHIKYIFYPVFPRILFRKSALNGRLDRIGESLQASRQQVLGIAMNIPCFSISNSCWLKYQDRVICMHKNYLPENYNADFHTFHMLPPVFSGLDNCHLINHLTDDELPPISSTNFPDLLDVTYPTYNGKGKAEDYTEFMIRAYEEEQKYRPPIGKFKK